MQNGKLLATSLKRCVNGLLDFLSIGHAGRYNHGLSCTSHILNEWQVYRLKRGYLIGRGIKILQ